MGQKMAKVTVGGGEQRISDRHQLRGYCQRL